MRQKSTISYVLLLGLLLADAAAKAQAPQDYAAVVQQGSDLLVEIAAGVAGPAERIELRLNKDCVREASLALAPAGWKAGGEGGSLVLEGPALVRFPAVFRLRVGEAKAPPAVRLRIWIAGEKTSDRDLQTVHIPPAIVSEGIEGLLALPAIVFAEESVLGRILIPQATPANGTWFFDGRRAENANETVRFSAPRAMASDSATEVRFEDPVGRTVVRGVAHMRVEPSPDKVQAARLEGVQPVALAGEALTVCGWFPPAAREAILLDGKPGLELIAGSNRSLLYTLPEAAEPGPHSVAGDPAAGFTGGALKFLAIKVDATVERAARPPQIRIAVRGTEERVRLRAVNLNPFAASLEGGESQLIETSGGAENLARIALQPAAPSRVAAPALNIAFTLAGGRDACANQ